jgi:hypothetical protein
VSEFVLLIDEFGFLEAFDWIERKRNDHDVMTVITLDPSTCCATQAEFLLMI